MKQIYNYAYAPLCATILLLGAAGLLPRVGRSTKGEGTERRYFYGSVWAVVIAQTVLLAFWKALAQTRTASLIKLAIFCAHAAGGGPQRLPRRAPAHAAHRPRRIHGRGLVRRWPLNVVNRPEL